MAILAGDIGGTKTLLQLSEAGEVLLERRYDSTAYADFDALLADFLREAETRDVGEISAACIGVAGPVVGREARVTNLPWRLDADALAVRFRLGRLRLINDFQAVGYGLQTLRGEDLRVLQAGRPQARAPQALIGAGTGLGEGILVWCEGHYEVLPSEGGHVDFGPTDALQRDLLAWLSQRQRRVTYENLVSGPGLVLLYRFMAEREPARVDAALLAALDAGEGAAAIHRQAEAGDPLAGETLDLFLTLYGAQAGNLALTCLAAGGVYVAGGIAPRLADRMADGRFMAAFRDKGMMTELLQAYPVWLVMNPRVGLQGAAVVAERLAAKPREGR